MEHVVEVDYNNHYCACLTITSSGSIYTGYGYRNLTVYGDVTADGEIGSGSWSLTLHLKGDLTLNARMHNYETELAGASDQTIVLGPAGLLAPNTLSATGGGAIIAATALVCSTMADLGDRPLLLQPGTGLELTGGSIDHAAITAGGEPLTFGGGAWIGSSVVSDPVIRGGARIYSNVSFTGTAVVEDTLHPHYGTVYLTVENIENHGVIEDTNWGLYIDVTGSLVNRGAWDNHKTTLAGSGDQSAELDDTYDVGQMLTLQSDLGGTGFYWTQNGSVVPGQIGTNCDLSPAGTSHHGVWRCHSSEGDSRSFVLNGEANTGVAGAVPPTAISVGNSPNPFNPTTTFRFTVGGAGRARLDVYDAGGRLVETLFDGVAAAGENRITWNAPGRASGVYFYRLESAAGLRTGKCVLVR